MVCSLNFNRDGHKLSVEAGSGIPLLNVATGGGKLRDGRQSDARHAATRRRRRKGFAKIFTGLHLFEGLRRKHEADEVEELEGKANGDDVPAKEWGADGVSVVARGITIRKLIEHSRQRTVSDLGLVPQLLLEGVCSIKEVKCLRERLHYLCPCAAVAHGSLADALKAVGSIGKNSTIKYRPLKFASYDGSDGPSEGEDVDKCLEGPNDVCLSHKEAGEEEGGKPKVDEGEHAEERVALEGEELREELTCWCWRS
mmetsp:Transcript_27973/g.65201  ORF Transcript_27973/g.65201 Transcript_27973/m.65201 type:complete len:255 (+) Transcript_27973:258-1022(+)